MKKQAKSSAGAAELAALPNLGPRSTAMLCEIGIDDVAALRRAGTLGAYRALRFRFGRAATMNFLYALEGALIGVDWRALEPSRREELRAAARLVNDNLARETGAG